MYLHACTVPSVQVNNYQTIVISDGYSTYIIFSYICGGIQWTTPPGSNRPAVVGYYNRGNFYTHPDSGLETVGNAVSCPLETRKRQSDGQMDPTNITSPNNEEMYNLAREGCRNFVQGVRNNFIEHLGGKDKVFYFNLLVQEGYICPPSVMKVKMDARFQGQTNNNHNCYVSSTIQYTSSGAISLNLAQQCCYDDRLVTT